MSKEEIMALRKLGKESFKEGELVMEKDGVFELNFNQINMKLGIEKTKKGIEALTSMIERGEIILKDGKITWLEGVGSFGELKAFIASLLDASDIISEAKDYDEAEISELVGYFKEKLKLENDKAELLIEKFLEVAAGVAEIVQAVSVGGGGGGDDPTNPDGND